MGKGADKLDAPSLASRKLAHGPAQTILGQKLPKKRFRLIAYEHGSELHILFGRIGLYKPCLLAHE